MRAYWDTSALLALLFDEPHTARARTASALCTEIHSWSWLRIEAEAGASRREPSEIWRASLDPLLRTVRWLEISPSEHSSLLTLNRRHRLRAADAGHLYCFSRLSLVHPQAQLVCFDAELCAAARAEKLRVWSP
jgi:predicted nucleic acid-binding protein